MSVLEHAVKPGTIRFSSTKVLAECRHLFYRILWCQNVFVNLFCRRLMMF